MKYNLWFVMALTMVDIVAFELAAEEIVFATVPIVLLWCYNILFLKLFGWWKHCDKLATLNLSLSSLGLIVFCGWVLGQLEVCDTIFLTAFFLKGVATQILFMETLHEYEKGITI